MPDTDPQRSDFRPDVAAPSSRLDGLVRLSDHQIQLLLREINQRDLLTALTAASVAVREKVLSNINAALRGFMETEMRTTPPPDTSRLRAAEEHIALLADDVEGVAARLEAASGRWAGEVLHDIAQHVTRTPVSRMSMDELRDTLMSIILGGRALAPEVAALEFSPDELGERLLLLGLGMTAADADPDLVTEVLETRMRTYLHQQEIRCRMIIAGIKATQQGQVPAVAGRALEAYY